MSLTMRLATSYLFCFGYAPNVFNLVFPEAFFLTTKKRFGWLPRNINIIIVIISLVIPFGWLLISLLLLGARYITNEVEKYNFNIDFSTEKNLIF